MCLLFTVTCLKQVNALIYMKEKMSWATQNKTLYEGWAISVIKYV